MRRCARSAHVRRFYAHPLDRVQQGRYNAATESGGKPRRIGRERIERPPHSGDGEADTAEHTTTKGAGKGEREGAGDPRSGVDARGRGRGKPPQRRDQKPRPRKRREQSGVPRPRPRDGETGGAKQRRQRPAPQARRSGRETPGSRARKRGVPQHHRLSKFARLLHIWDELPPVLRGF